MVADDYRSLHTSPEPATTPITIRAAKEPVSKIDALAAAMDPSRNYVINQTIEHVEAGLADARAGRTDPADEVFAAIAGKHGWKV